MNKFNVKQLDDLLKQCRGKVYSDYNIGKFTFFKTGGNAKYLFIPEDIADLQYFLQNKAQDINVFVLGLGSNTLIRDGGYNGVIIKLNHLNQLKLINNTTIYAEANVLDKTVANIAKTNSISGLEFLYTIPGCIGGAFAMNAGAYGKEFKDVFVSAEVMKLNGEIITLTKEDINFNYRSTTLKINQPVILLNAILEGEAGNCEDISNIMQQMEDKRLKTQPLANIRTGGSTFANPSNKKAWELISAVGGSSLSVNSAKVSDKHCNFLENTGNATAKDIEDLGELIKIKVKDKFNIDLIWEIKIVGEHK